MIGFNHPFTALVSGSTGSGKTVLLRKILLNHKELIPGTKKSILKVIWCYGIYQSLYAQIIENVDVEYVRGLARESDIQSKRPDVIVIDDLMHEKSNDQNLTSLFTRGSHHLGISIFFVVQNLFAKGLRTISLNAHYLILMKNPRDKSQIQMLGRQLYPGKSKFFLESYEEATKRKFGYLIIDLSPYTDDELRLKSKILPDEGIKGKIRPEVYVPL